jgi:predicted peptidase
MIEQAKTFSARIIEQVDLPYLLHLPDGYGKAEKPWPLILFLHGAGERGTDIDLIRVHGLPRVVPLMDDFPFIAISPQCPVNRWWSDYVDALFGLLDTLAANYNVDTRRVYLTGMSMGGFGTWHLAVEQPARFAAIAPICGGGIFAYGFPERAAVLKDMPTWVFHGAKDPTVPLEASQELVDVLEASGGNVKFTVYPDAEHDSWTETYNNPALYEWFLQHRR